MKSEEASSQQVLFRIYSFINNLFFCYNMSFSVGELQCLVKISEMLLSETSIFWKDISACVGHAYIVEFEQIEYIQR